MLVAADVWRQVWNGLPMANLTAASALVRESFPDAVIWTNAAVPPLSQHINIWGSPVRVLAVACSIQQPQVNYTVPPTLSWSVCRAGD